jgi:hypothetical protein
MLICLRFEALPRVSASASIDMLLETSQIEGLCV